MLYGVLVREKSRRNVECEPIVMKIVSLLPSATEIICELGLGDDLVGVTHECDYPVWVTNLPKVTRTLIPHDASSRDIDALVRERLKTDRALYSLDLPTLERLAPDLIVTQALCDVCAVAEAEVQSAACHLPGQPKVINLEPSSLEDVLTTLAEVANIAGRPELGEAALERLRCRIDNVTKRTSQATSRPRVVILEWLDPLFSSGHWSPELTWMAGGEEVIGMAGERSRTIAWDEVVAARPDVLFIACCGFTLERTLLDLPSLFTHSGWSELPAVRSGNVYVTDGNAYFSRPGPRLVDSLEIMAHALHPDLFGLPSNLVPARRISEW